MSVVPLRDEDPSSPPTEAYLPALRELELKIQVLTQLESLPDGALLDKLMMLVDMPVGMRPPAMNAALQRALALVEWADSPLGCGCEALQTALGKLVSPAPPPPPRLVTWDATDEASAEADAAEAALREAESRLKSLIKANAPARQIEQQRDEIAALRRARYEGASLVEGQTLADRFELLDLLGAGGFGSVWRAYDGERRGNVAIKVLHRRFRADETMKRRFRLGARIMQELAREHKHVVQVLEPPRQSGGFEFFVMEFLAKGSLESAVLEQRFTNEELYPAIFQVGEALHFAHTRSVIHRDVNPANILIHADGSFRLSDFDIARVPLTSIGSAAQIGRPEYMAPEVLYGGSKGDARSDLYALAKTVQFLIWGQELPLEGKKDAAAFSVALPCPTAVQFVLQKALADDPGRRYASVAEFLVELEKALESEDSDEIVFATDRTDRDTAVCEGADDEHAASRESKTTNVASELKPPPPPPLGVPTDHEPASAPEFGINRRFVQWPEGPPLDHPDYEVIDALGRGGMGSVYRARQSAFNREVALKVLAQDSRRSGRQQAAGQQKFLAEAVIAGALDHPHIAPLYDLGVDQLGRLFYAMKIVRGNLWSSLLPEKPERENLEILVRLCDAVAYAHAQGVVHRDLKPANVMLGDYGELYVMDWGLAAASEEFQESTQTVMTGTIGGTPAYMAPEMVSGPAHQIGPAADVYLLGATLYEILTGRPPHKGDSVMQVIFAASKNEITPTEREDDLISVAARAMATRPEDRYASVREFQQALREYLYRQGRQGSPTR